MSNDRWNYGRANPARHDNVTLPAGQHYTIDIPYQINTPNRKPQNVNAQRAMNADVRDHVALVARSIRNKGNIPEATIPMRLSIMWHRRVKQFRKMDDDNLRAALKNVVDGLVHAGVVVDDSPEWLIGGKAEVNECQAHPRRGQFIEVTTSPT